MFRCGENIQNVMADKVNFNGVFKVLLKTPLKSPVISSLLYKNSVESC